MEAIKHAKTDKIKVSVDQKYWIKQGMSVMHRESNNKMIVDHVVKKSKEIYQDGQKVRKTFTVGVDCHWIDSKGTYQTGRFFTYELIPGDEK